MKSPLNFGMMPAVGNLMNPFGGNMFGSGGAHQYIAQQIQQQQQQQQAAAQAQAAMQDPNNASATGFSSIGGEQYADPSMQAATGNAPNNTVTAGMAIGNAPIATVGGFNPATTTAAQGIYGSETDRATSMSPKKLVTL